MEIRFSLNDINEAARLFIRSIGNARVIAFYGSMGAGKTTFIRAICQAMGVEDTVTSPSFAIVNEYTTKKNSATSEMFAEKEEHIFHFDFYRISKLEEVYDMGYEEYFYSGYLCFIEWPELVEPLLPDSSLRVRIEETSDGARLISNYQSS